ncbi:MAG: hypothetical protein ACRD3W_19275, partial [Terriglobales bacterium]
MPDERKDEHRLRPLPQVDKVLRHPLVQAELQWARRDVLADLTRRELSLSREAAGGGGEIPDAEQVAARVVERLNELKRGGIRRVLNGTGVILNTNLGRAPLSAAIAQKLAGILPGYCTLEFDLESGKRGERTALLDDLLSLLIGSEMAIVVNNNAAAVMLAVSALAHGKEVIVSRGELIEIGGSFR